MGIVCHFQGRNTISTEIVNYIFVSFKWMRLHASCGEYDFAIESHFIICAPSLTQILLIMHCFILIEWTSIICNYILKLQQPRTIVLTIICQTLGGVVQMFSDWSYLQEMAYLTKMISYNRYMLMLILLPSSTEAVCYRTKELIYKDLFFGGSSGELKSLFILWRCYC